MSHIQERTEQETRNFFAKLKDSYAARFNNVTSVVQREVDGDTDDDTLIHRAFVKYFEGTRQPYPDWLGEKRRPLVAQTAPQSRSFQGQQQMASSQRPRLYQEPQVADSYQDNQGQPPFQRGNSWSQGRAQVQQATSHQEAQSAPARTYTRSSSRLQDMYNRSREQSVPGSGYSSQSYQPVRTNSSGNGSSSRLRDHMLNSTSQPSPSGQSRATWGRK